MCDFWLPVTFGLQNKISIVFNNENIQKFAKG